MSPVSCDGGSQRGWRWPGFGLEQQHHQACHTDDGCDQEQPGPVQRSWLSQLVRPSSTRSRAQSSSSRVVIRGGMKRITLASGPQLMTISSRSKACFSTWLKALASGVRLSRSVTNSMPIMRPAAHIPDCGVTVRHLVESLEGSLRQIPGVWEQAFHRVDHCHRRRSRDRVPAVCGAVGASGQESMVSREEPNAERGRPLAIPLPIAMMSGLAS